MAKYPCRRCIYSNACGDNSRTTPCKGRTLPSEIKKRCVICGEEIETWGNNPRPIKDYGVCCDECNMRFVVPARIANLAGDTRKTRIST